MNSLKDIIIFLRWANHAVRHEFNLPKKPRAEHNTICIAEAIEPFETALLHVGLKSVSIPENKDDRVSTIFSTLDSLKTIAVPAFTPSFRTSGLYSKPFCRPEKVGAFSTLCHNLTTYYRTNDPLHSLYIFGNRHPFLPNSKDTFASDGLYSFFCKQGGCWINIGTNELVSTALHYIERMAMVPYLNKKTLSGVIYFNESEHDTITLDTYSYKRHLAWNRSKIENDLIKNGCLERGINLGCICRIIDGTRATEYLLSRIRKDPLYLIS